MIIHSIARRLITEMMRDRRTVVFILFAPILVMTLVYYAVRDDPPGRIAVVTRGASRLYSGDLENALSKEDDLRLVSLRLPDDEGDEATIEATIRAALLEGEIDGVLYMGAQLLPDRFEGEAGQLHIYVEGSRPDVTATVLSGVASAMDDLASALPVVIDGTCPGYCADSVNPLPMDLEKHYLFGSEDERAVDYFLPVLPPFFVFFFTFILSTVTFQRERVRGTLERLLIAPISFRQIVAGYVFGFMGFAGVQALIITVYFLFLISFPISAVQVASLSFIILVSLVIALLLGLVASFLAHSEFQALQFIPLVILPQIFLSDIIWKVSDFPWLFRMISYTLPLTHANRAVRAVLVRGESVFATWPQLAVLGLMMLFILGLLMAVGRRVHRVL